ncbi:MAG: DUF1015 family protein [Actinomycetota bacterium]
MPDIAAFSGIRFDPSRVDYARVTSPPYDVISERERADLESESPYNIVRLILGPLEEPGNRKYAAANTRLHQWLSEGVLKQDAEPSLYLYEESFEAAGAHRKQVGLLAAVTISDEILPHERTMAPIVEDRLDVIRSTKSNLSPVFCLYWTSHDTKLDALDASMRTEPYASFETRDGLRHRAWKISDSQSISSIANALANARVVIADGHHRYRTAEAYRAERTAKDGSGPWDRMLLYLVNAERDAPALLPIHRLVSELTAHDAIDAMRRTFSIEPAAPDADLLAKQVQQRRGRCYGILSDEEAWIATLADEAAAADATKSAAGGSHCQAWCDLDVSILHSLVFDRLIPDAKVTFAHHPSEVSEAVRNRDASFGVLLAATPLDAVRAVAEAGDSMPAKSTFFVPKPRTGLVVRPLW